MATLVATFCPGADRVAEAPGGVLLARHPISGRERLIFGLGVLNQATRITTLTCVTITDEGLDAGVLDALAELDRASVKDLNWLASVGRELRDLPMAYEDISRLLGLWGRADAHRIVRLHDRPRSLREAAAKAGVTRAHLRYLTTLPDAAFAGSVKAIGDAKPRMSVRKLKASLSGETDGESGQRHPSSHNPDIDHYCSNLTAALGTEVKIVWPNDPSQRYVEVAWFTTDVLAGILQRLGAVGKPGALEAPTGKSPRRCLKLALQTNEELEAVFGSLGTEN